MNTGKLTLAVLFIATAEVPTACIAADTNLMSSAAHIQAVSSVPIAEKSELDSLASPNAWINSPPLTASQLRGKVVLIDFWTYTCINWRRTLPYLRAWHEKYHSQGLVVIGIHTPEFQFEKDPSNVRRAVQEMRIDYPVLADNDEAIWQAFNNQAWPTFYLIDPEGKVKYRLAGEGSYEQAEVVLRKMLSENGKKIDPDQAQVVSEGFEAAPDWAELKSPETYVGYQLTRNFASPGGMVRNRSNTYQAPAQLRLNEWALAGRWTGRKESITVDEPRGKIAYRFHARDLHLVMGPAATATSVKFRVLIDGHPPGAAHGLDVDENGDGMVTEQRVYQLVRQATPVMDRQIEIEFFDPGVEVFDFTFG